jgi:hypothetical protein
VEVLISYFPKAYATPDILDYTVPCELIKDLPRVDVLFGGYWMQIMPYDWVITTTDDSGTYCWVCFAENNTDDWLLGDSFLRGYYSVHDYNKQRFGFAPTTQSQKTKVERGTPPNTPLPQATYLKDSNEKSGL